MYNKHQINLNTMDAKIWPNLPLDPTHTDVCDYRAVNRLNQATRYPPDEMDHASRWPPMRIWRGTKWLPALDVHNCKCGTLGLAKCHISPRLCSHGYSRSILHPEFCDECDRHTELSHPLASFTPKRIYAPSEDDAPDAMPPLIVGLGIEATPTPTENPGFLVTIANEHYRGLRGVYKRPLRRKPRKSELAQLIEFQRHFRDMPTSPYCGWICEPFLNQNKQS